MSDILWLTENIRDTSAHIAQLERTILQNPGEAGLAINLRSLQKRLGTLEGEFAQQANSPPQQHKL